MPRKHCQIQGLLSSTIWGITRLFSKASVPFYNSTTNVWGFPFLHIFTNTYCLFLNIPIPVGVKYYLTVVCIHFWKSSSLWAWPIKNAPIKSAPGQLEAPHHTPVLGMCTVLAFPAPRSCSKDRLGHKFCVQTVWTVCMWLNQVKPPVYMTDTSYDFYVNL